MFQNLKTWLLKRKLKRIDKKVRRANWAFIGAYSHPLSTEARDKRRPVIIGSEDARKSLIGNRDAVRTYALAVVRGSTSYVKYYIPEVPDGEAVVFAHSQIEKGGVTKCQKSL